MPWGKRSLSESKKSKCTPAWNTATAQTGCREVKKNDLIRLCGAGNDLIRLCGEEYDLIRLCGATFP